LGLQKVRRFVGVAAQVTVTCRGLEWQLPLAEAFGEQGRVFAFEPTRFAYEKLAADLSLNRGMAKRVTPAQVMLANADQVEVAEEIYQSWPVSDEFG
jgi:hypothetical protein